MASPTDAASVLEARNVAKILEPMGERLPGDIRAGAVLAAAATLEATATELGEIDARRTVLINNRAAQRKALNDLLSRVKSGVRSVFGDDSNEYELVGGTRRSERKRPVRRQPA